MSISLKADAGGTFGSIQVGGVDALSVKPVGATLELSRSGVAPFAVVDATGKVSFPQNAQTWQDVKASRSLGTSFTNNTGQPIQVSVTASSSTSAAISLVVGGVTLFGSGVPAGSISSITANIPNGASYTVDVSAGTGTLGTWVELR